MAENDEEARLLAGAEDVSPEEAALLEGAEDVSQTSDEEAALLAGAEDVLPTNTKGQTIYPQPGLLERAPGAVADAYNYLTDQPDLQKKVTDPILNKLDKVEESLPIPMRLAIFAGDVAAAGFGAERREIVPTLKMLMPTRLDYATLGLAKAVGMSAKALGYGAKVAKVADASASAGRIGIDDAAEALKKPAYLRAPGKKVLSERTPEVLDAKTAENIRGFLKAQDEAAAADEAMRAKAAGDEMLDSLKRITRIVQNAEDSGADPRMIMTEAERALYGKFRPAIRSSIDHKVPLEAILSDSEIYTLEIRKATQQGAASRIAEKLSPGGASEAAPEWAGNINLKNINTSDDVKSMMKDVAEGNAAAMKTQSRGRVTEAETRATAEQLGVNIDAIKPGTAVNDAELLAIRETNALAAMNAHRKAVRALSIGTEEAKADALQATARLLKTMEVTSGVTAEAGRALNSLKYKVGGEGEMLAKGLKQVINSFGGDDKAEAILDGLSKLDPNNPRSINQFVREATKGTTWDKLMELRRNFLLSGPATHISNILSNTLTGTVRGLVEKPIEGTIDFARSKLTGSQQNVYAGEAVAEFQGFLGSLPEAWANAADIFKTGVSRFDGDLLELGKLKPDAIKGKAGQIVRLPTRALAMADEFFKTINSRASLRAQAYRQAMKEGKKGKALYDRTSELAANPSKQMVDKAFGEAAYRTFTDDLGVFGNKLMALRASEGPWGKAMQFVLPFLKTPMNIAAYGAERTPLGMAKVLYKAGKAGGSYDGVTDDLAKVAMGSTAAAATAMLWADGRITGSGPTDPSQRAVWLAANQPNSIRIGNSWVSYNRLEPVGMSIGLMADALDIKAQRKNLVDDDSLYNAIVPAVSNNVMNKQWLRGFGELFQSIAHPDKYGQRLAQSMAASLVPSAMGSVVRGIDPALRRPGGVGDAMAAKVPGLSAYVPPVRDIFGRPVLVAGNGPERAVSPFRRMTYVQDFTTREAARLQLGLSPLKRVVEFDAPKGKKLRVEMQPDEYDAMLELAGKRAKEHADRFTSSPIYKNLSDERKAETLGERIREGRNRGREEYIRANRDRLKERAK